MTRVRWSSLSAAVAVGVVAGFAIGVAIGVAVGRGAAPAAGPATVVDDPGRTVPASGAAPMLAGTGAPPSANDRLTLDVGADAALAWAQLEVLLSSGRLEEAAIAGAAYCRRDAGRIAAVEARVAQLDRPANRLRVYDAMRALGIAIPTDGHVYDGLRAVSGRAAEVLRDGPDALSVADPDAFRALLAEALRRGFDDAAVRAVAARDDSHPPRSPCVAEHLGRAARHRA